MSVTVHWAYCDNRIRKGERLELRDPNAPIGQGVLVCETNNFRMGPERFGLREVTGPGVQATCLGCIDWECGGAPTAPTLFRRVVVLGGIEGDPP